MIPLRPSRLPRFLVPTLIGLCGMILIGTALMSLGTGGLFLLLLHLSLARDGYPFLLVSLPHLLGILLPVSIAVLPAAAAFVERMPYGRRTLLCMIGTIAGTWWAMAYASLLLDGEAAKVVATVGGGIGGLSAALAYRLEPGRLKPVRA